MKKLLLVAILAGAFFFKPQIMQWVDQQNSNGAFDEKGDPKIVLLTHKTCGDPCNSARKYLTSHKLLFTEIDINENEQEWEYYGKPKSSPLLVVGNQRANYFSSGDYSSTLAMALGGGILSNQEKRIYQKHFYADGSPKIVLYGTDWCKYCTILRNDFSANNIDYLDYDVEKPRKQTWLLKALSINGYPTAYYGYKRIHAADYEKVMAAM
jgi:glutaredoxin